ncbi:hypothetical protein [Kitasatospora kifunensis]|uniref:Uncharacterized protein n=1 Tax=Kitasatospora kifunensis TaxID=58351 RepID=A0A7W7RAA2_KITKI|nr:hypothetical protein [Kitasatospora kifunensis]MBB4928293.1 hypothetical protein [Kitasatospora kifunensis]
MTFTFDLSVSQRLLVLGSLCHLTAGTSYLALTGINGTRVPIRRQEIGTGAGAAVATAMVWALVVVLWPIPLVCRAVRALRPRPGATQPGDELIWRSRPAAASPPPVQPTRTPAAQPDVPPHWYRREYEAACDALAYSPAAGAARAAALIEHCVLAFGPAHLYTRDAWELLAHTARLALAEQQPFPGPAPLPVPRPGALAERPVAGTDGVYLPHCPYAA